MVREDDRELSQSSLLEVHNRVIVQVKTHLGMIVTHANVLS